jgi:hypothetical protein
MPVPSSGYYEITATSVGAPVTVSLPTIKNNPPKDIRAQVMITELVNNTGDPKWAAGVYISQYTQAGTEHPTQQEIAQGKTQWRQLAGSNITELTLTTTVYNATVYRKFAARILLIKKVALQK